MGRARRARKIAATAAYGGGGLAAAGAALGMLGYGVIKTEAALARRVIGTPFDDSPQDDGSYGTGSGRPWELVVLGDSSAAGMGADHPHETVGAIVANGVSALTGRPVRLTNRAVVGAESGDLERQLANALEEVVRPDVVLVMVGTNDVTHRIERTAAVHHLEQTVRRVRALGSEVVVGTCPDLGAIAPIRQPLRALMKRWSRDLAAAQTVAVVEAGGRTVSLGDLLGPEFAASPQVMFSRDRFHPSPAGYARAAAVLLPSVCAALGVWGTDTDDRAPEPRRGEGVGPVAVAAGQAVRAAGTEVSPTELGGQSRGPRGRWAMLLRRRPDTVPPAADPSPSGAAPDAAAPAEQDEGASSADDGGASATR
ncbi:SGNH/GDSL hydrolase family protein [Phycicoccus endophyticus]|uniref:SGNH/GDSL hydrolase family protein n=1 Tax=Phycicoccus endophyticus TaxID=1690220 RepID=A0A7G9R2H9_9MICO|nr:SGNH/GDSL hydrolase family protein [Phycicoccus endophyticus]NHI20739.1 SGNH/GDSL hydrolase family protein [Phycicoccus endophyticus]QNN49804.1 SGNH/GDSL hydrolase family protein [Phycicoccus endophyticus]GGL35263.1 lipase [Phycicoccus endophyticus]